MVEGLLTHFAHDSLAVALISFSVVMERPLLKVSGIVQEIVIQFLSSPVRTVMGVDMCISTPPIHTLDSIPALQQLFPRVPLQLRAGHLLHGSASKGQQQGPLGCFMCLISTYLHKICGPGHQGCKTDFSETLRHCEGEQTVT